MTSDSTIQEKMKTVHWVPLESNPDMLSGFAWGVGLPKGWEFVDVYGVDPEMLGMVPGTCCAVTLLFGNSDKLKGFREEQRKKIEAEGGGKVSGNLVYLKQYVGNACGTIAAIHSIANNAEAMGLSEDTPLGRFLAKIRGMTPVEAGLELANAQELHQASETSAAGGQTAAPEATADVDAHFIAFVEKEGDVYELDGVKVFPINHGPSDGSLLKAAAKVIKSCFMDQDPDSIQFNMMALVKSE
eukprot:CAMPEP_0171101170 /NCGR_PEP_ID=MMETSP0766_2-20121228/54168_1 /TAXON_ID=439317 /ORGANISM="Gambierdiscus australes, Strain CAWD 149" /LENGTH=242 /DNA_ID=CAMNT_0011561147 /DNA_START=60 /DNA_END=788 /DNA_ORIENTATION=+